MSQSKTIKESLGERLNQAPKEKISISIDSNLLQKIREILKKEYPNASLSRFIEIALEDFTAFHFHNPKIEEDTKHNK